ncbi:family 43 glycosylhydrolase [Novosphingobium sp.]|uniref:family 43 glycosylhydrolase n=1 Tax=Novosphingobium sp. TaxID=1874826 RepID=UPI00260AAFA4|nr:family 43 glycosylhydrolase [Novosphingobium sp.]
MTLLDRRSILAGTLATSLAGITRAGAATPPRYTSFRPGEPWLDSAGKPIQAHGGSMFVHDGAFYWYGENKEFTTGKNEIFSWGVRCYRSTDLYNWDDLGLIIPPDETDRSSPLHPSAGLDRPHIVYHPGLKRFVCWVKMVKGAIQTRAVLVADAFTGPYRLIRQGIAPVGMSAGDFDLAVSPDDGKAYMYFERAHSELICADLSEDYTEFTGYYSTHFPRPGPPTVREGIAHFVRGNRHYIASSGTTGYFPNPSEIAVGETWHGPFTRLGDLHPRDRTRTSFNSQISCIFRHPGKRDLYIAMADRWMGPQSGADFANGDRSRLVQRAFAKDFARPKQPLTAEERRARFELGGLEVNTSQARYVWLPLTFPGGVPRIDWRDEWSLDEFA